MGSISDTSPGPALNGLVLSLAFRVLGKLGIEGKDGKRIRPKHLMHKHLCHLLFLLPNVAKHIRLNDSSEPFLVDYRGYLQADAFHRYDGLCLAQQCSPESPLNIEH
jgi:hypothetical protein